MSQIEARQPASQKVSNTINMTIEDTIAQWHFMVVSIVSGRKTIMAVVSLNNNDRR